MSKVYLVGAGPGDPDLLTVKARRILRDADVVLYDRLVSAEVLAVASSDAELIYVGKHEGEQESTQKLILDLMVNHARRGRRVARLKGGDGCVFGRAGEECLALTRAGIDVEVVPGVSSALAAPTLAGIPLTFRNVSRGFAVVTGHCAGRTPIDWRDWARIDTLVILMGVKNRAAIASALIDAGRRSDEPAAFVERASTAGQRVVETTLGEVARGAVEVEAPAVFVIGAVAALRAELAACVLEEVAL
jgi:uroporphyrin-III C-methyltransferase